MPEEEVVYVEDSGVLVISETSDIGESSETTEQSVATDTAETTLTYSEALDSFETGTQDSEEDGGVCTFRFVHNQAVPSATWNVPHSLNGFPNVTVVDSANTEVEGQVTYVDEDNLTIVFSSAFAGKAFLS